MATGSYRATAGNHPLLRRCGRGCNTFFRVRYSLASHRLGIIFSQLIANRTQNYPSTHDILALGLLQYFLDTEINSGQSLASIIRTNLAAINILRSLLNIDPMDALEDYLARKYHQYTDVPHLLSLLEDLTCDPASRSFVFEAMHYDALTYAIQLSPQRVAALLAEGEDVTGKPYLIYAVRAASPSVLKHLLEAGADVNMRDFQGYTALHYACSWCYYSEIVELFLWAENDVDWNARTPDGQTGWELFEVGVSKGHAWRLTSSEIEHGRSILLSHLDSTIYEVMVDDDYEDYSSTMPGAFPHA